MKIGPINTAAGAPHTLQYEPEDLAALPELPPKLAWYMLLGEPAVYRKANMREAVAWVSEYASGKWSTYIKLGEGHTTSGRDIPVYDSLDDAMSVLAAQAWLGLIETEKTE